MVVQESSQPNHDDPARTYVMKVQSMRILSIVQTNLFATCLLLYYHTSLVHVAPSCGPLVVVAA